MDGSFLYLAEASEIVPNPYAHSPVDPDLPGGAYLGDRTYKATSTRFWFLPAEGGRVQRQSRIDTRICVVLHKEDREKNETVSPEEDAGEEPRTMLLLITVLRYRDQFCPRTCKVRSWDMGISQYLP